MPKFRRLLFLSARCTYIYYSVHHDLFILFPPHSLRLPSGERRIDSNRQNIYSFLRMVLASQLGKLGFRRQWWNISRAVAAEHMVAAQ